MRIQDDNNQLIQNDDNKETPVSGGKVSNADLMRKLMLFGRKTRLGGMRKGPGQRTAFAPAGYQGPTDGCPHRLSPQNPMPPHHGSEQNPNAMPSMPPHGPGMEQHPMSPHGPGMEQHPMRPMPPHGSHRDPGMHRPPLSREQMLVIIGRHPEGIRQKAVADRLGINQSSASEMVNTLESTGYLERKLDPSDKRATLLFLTEKGAARAAEVEDERDAMFQNIFAPLTEEEKAALSGILDKLLMNL